MARVVWALVVALSVVAAVALHANATELDVRTPGAGSATSHALPLEFTPSNARSLTNGSLTVMVAFLARPAPAFEAELVKLNDDLGDSDTLVLAVANCAANREFIRDYGLTTFPAVRVFPAGLISTPFEVPFTHDLTADKLQEQLRAYEHAVTGLPAAYGDSVAAFRQYLFGPENRGDLDTLKRATVSHALARAPRWLLALLIPPSVPHATSADACRGRTDRQGGWRRPGAAQSYTGDTRGRRLRARSLLRVCTAEEQAQGVRVHGQRE